MKVTAWHSLDVEFEADVSFDDVLTEFGKIVEGASSDRHAVLLGSLDWITRILARVPDDVIAAMPERAREILCERLCGEAGRYDPAP